MYSTAHQILPDVGYMSLESLLWILCVPASHCFRIQGGTWLENRVKREIENSGYNTIIYLKVARYSFSRPIPPKFEHKLRRHKQSFGKIATTVVLDKDENLLWSGLQWHRSCHSNEMTLLPILLTEVFLGTGNCSSKIIHESFFLQ